MERTSSSRPVIKIDATTTPDQLKKFLEAANPNDRLRFKNNELFCRQDRKGGLLSQAQARLIGTTESKRQELWTTLSQVFRNNGVSLDEHVAKVLLPHERDKLKAANGDLKAKHLLKVFTGTVKVDGKDYRYDRLHPFAHGSYGNIYKATSSDSQELALKVSITPVAEQDAAQRRETEMHLLACSARLGPVNYVVETGALVTGYDGSVIQPMGLAICSGNKLIDALSKPSHEFHGYSILLRTAHDWLSSLCQIDSVGIAHRDIKPENWLLSKDGVWQLSDFGTASPGDSIFVAKGGKKGSHDVTGNGNLTAKAPEWLKIELPHVTGTYQVGHAADVFALGVAVFRMINGGRKPFDPPPPEQESTNEIEYEERVLDYAGSGLNYSDWCLERHGQKVPLEWQDFLNGALHVDPAKRSTARELLSLPIFSALDKVDEGDIRRQLVQMANHLKGNDQAEVGD